MTLDRFIAFAVIVVCSAAAGVLSERIAARARTTPELDRLKLRNRDLWRWSSRKLAQSRAELATAAETIAKQNEERDAWQRERDEWLNERAHRCPEMN